MHFPNDFQVLSWAPFNSGSIRTNCIFNHQLDGNKSIDSLEIFHNLIKTFNLPENSVGMLTAAKIRNFCTHYLQSGPFWVQAICTVGLDNTRTVGEKADVDSQSEIGTINLILVTNSLPDLSGQLEALQVCTMAKTRALAEMKIKSSKSGTPATGTGTDCIALATSGELKQNYCGMHTRLGELIGRATYETIKEGIEKNQ
ncbi:MAG: adenosylcobinamide amidohydrolase [Nitrospinota bacterium]